jgi:hypothetical protein
MRYDDYDGTLVSENGWRQGSILTSALINVLIAEHQIPEAIVSSNEAKSGFLSRFFMAIKRAALRKQAVIEMDSHHDRWMVISQDCDLLQPDLSKEPFVELIRIRPASGSHLPPAWGQSPREMQFNDPPGLNGGTRFVCSVHDRVRIDRQYLQNQKPDHDREFNKENVKRICHWISRRYVRAAFPDAFNDRVKPSLDSLTDKKSQLNKMSDLLTGVYIRVSEAELEIDEDYEVIIWASMRPQDYEDYDRNTEAQELLGLLESTLGSCRGIEIVECELKSEQEITLDHLRTWKRWDFDVLSLRPKKKSDPLPPVDNLPPEL